MGRFLQTILILLIGLAATGCTGGFDSAGTARNNVNLASDAAALSRFEAAKAVLGKHCTSCHDAGASQGNFDHATQDPFISLGLVVPGDEDASKLLQRTIHYAGSVNSVKNMPKNNTTGFSKSDYAVLRDWVVGMLNTPVPEIFQCDLNQPLHERVRQQDAARLSLTQYKNALVDLLARSFSKSFAASLVDSAVTSANIPANVKGVKFHREDTSLSLAHTDGYFQVADQIAATIASQAGFNSFVSRYVAYAPGSCGTVSLTSKNCLDAFSKNLALRAFRRPLIQNAGVDELAELHKGLNTVSVSAKSFEDVVFKILLSPKFLFHLYDNENVIDPANELYSLSSYSLIAKMSFLLWDTLPDETLLQYAASGQWLQDSAIYSQVVDYLVNHQNFKGTMTTFFREWLKMDEMPDFNPLSDTVFQAMSRGLNYDAQMKTEMIKDVEEFSWYQLTAGGNFVDLFTDNTATTNDPELMAIYEMTQPATLPVTSANRVGLSNHSGILTRAGFLISGNEVKHPVKRGVHIREEILCIPMALPPPDLPAGALTHPVPDPNKTNRELWKEKTSGPLCIGCHAQINPVGFAFEAYSPFGFYEPQEPTFNADGSLSGSTLPVDQTVDLSPILGPGFVVSNATEASEKFARYQKSQACFTETVQHYFNNGVPDKNRDACRLNSIYQKISSDSSLLSAIKEVVFSEEFKHRLINK